MAYPQVYSSETGQWTSLIQESFTIENIDGVDISSSQNNDVLRYSSSASAYINEPITTLISDKNITPATIVTSGNAVFNSASVVNNMTIGSSLTVNGVLITGSGSATVTTEQVQDAVAPLFDHGFHTNITATYDDANDRIILSASASSGSVSVSTEEIQDAAATLFTHSNHVNASATYNDALNQVVLSITNPTTQTNVYDVVRDYGVVPGEANSATKIQNALNAARDAGSGIVYIPAGTYNLQSTLEIFSGTTLYLTPKTVMFRQFASSPFLANGAYGASYSGYSGQSNIRIVGGIWESRGQAYPIQPAMGISIGHGTDIIIQDLTISNIGGYHAIEINSSKNVRIKNCRFVGYVDTGGRDYSEAIQIDLAKGSAYFGWFGTYDNTTCEDVVIDSCYFGSSSTGGTVAWPTGIGSHSYTTNYYHNNIKIINNTFEGLTEYAIRSFCLYKNLIISNNSIRNCYGGIAIGPDGNVDHTEPIGANMLAFAPQITYDVIISDNIIDNSSTTGTNGIWVVNANSVTISNNRIKGISRQGSNLADGILCVQVINLMINNNIIENIGDDGIDVRTNSTAVMISNNIIKNVSLTTNNTYRHIYLNNNVSNASVMINRASRTAANIAAYGIHITDTCSAIRYFGNQIGTAATSVVLDSSGGSTSTANA